MSVKALAFLLLISFAELPFPVFIHSTNTFENYSEPIPAPFNGKVIKIVDGDTYDVLTSDFKTIRIRMNGIDAPEKKQAYGTRSKDYLGSLCFGKTIRIVPMSYDRNKRLIADSFTDAGLNLSREMVRSGLAWHFKKYSKDKNLSDDEDHARKKRAGLWADNEPVAPWDFRIKR